MAPLFLETLRESLREFGGSLLRHLNFLNNSSQPCRVQQEYLTMMHRIPTTGFGPMETSLLEPLSSPTKQHIYYCFQIPKLGKFLTKNETRQIQRIIELKDGRKFGAPTSPNMPNVLWRITMHGLYTMNWAHKLGHGDGFCTACPVLKKPWNTFSLIALRLNGGGSGMPSFLNQILMQATWLAPILYQHTRQCSC